MHLFSQSLSIVLRCVGLLLNVIFSFSSSRCVRWRGFALIRVSCRCVIDVMLLHCVCCKRLIRAWIIVCSVSFHLLLSELGILSCGCSSSVSLEYQGRTSQLARCFSPAQTRVCNDLLYTVFDTVTFDGFRRAVNRWLPPWVVFFCFPWRRCLWGCESNLYKKNPLRPVLLVLIIIISCFSNYFLLFHARVKKSSMARSLPV